MLSDINRLTSVLKVISVQFIFILKDYRFLLFDLNVSNNSIMGVLGDVFSVGLNDPSVDESSKRWLGDVSLSVLTDLQQLSRRCDSWGM